MSVTLLSDLGLSMSYKPTSNVDVHSAVCRYPNLIASNICEHRGTVWKNHLAAVLFRIDLNVLYIGLRVFEQASDVVF